MDMKHVSYRLLPILIFLSIFLFPYTAHTQEAGECVVSQEAGECVVSALPHPALADGDGTYLSLMPTYGYADTWNGREAFISSIASSYDPSSEEIRQGYRSIHLDRWHIRAEVSAMDSMALYRFTFPKGNRYANVVLDLEGEAGEGRVEARIWPQDFFTLLGYRTLKGEASDTLFYAVCFDRPADEFVQDSLEAHYCQSVFDVTPGTRLMAWVTVSMRSEAEAFDRFKKMMVLMSEARRKQEEKTEDNKGE